MPIGYCGRNRRFLLCIHMSQSFRQHQFAPKFFPPFKDEGELIASWGEAELIRYLDGKVVLKGGSKEDRLAAQEWISLFWHEAVVRER